MADYNMLIRPEFIVIALFINGLGAILKYRTWVANKMLPLILFAVSFCICAIWGWFTSHYVGGARWVDSLLIAGLIHGMVVTAIAVWGWDTVYGAWKVGLKRKKKKEVIT